MRPRLLRRVAYGLDQKQEPDDHQGMNLEDTSTPASGHTTPINPVNSTGDAEAERQFPWLGEHTHVFPVHRGRN